MLFSWPRAEIRRSRATLGFQSEPASKAAVRKQLLVFEANQLLKASDCEQLVFSKRFTILVRTPQTPTRLSQNDLPRHDPSELAGATSKNRRNGCGASGRPLLHFGPTRHACITTSGRNRPDSKAGPAGAAWVCPVECGRVAGRRFEKECRIPFPPWTRRWSAVREGVPDPVFPFPPGALPPPRYLRQLCSCIRALLVCSCALFVMACGVCMSLCPGWLCPESLAKPGWLKPSFSRQCVKSLLVAASKMMRL